MQDRHSANEQSRPLRGVCVMVTRPANGPDPLAERLRMLGAEVVVQPAIRIAPPDDWRPVDEALTRLQEYDWLVFSSANGVRYLFDRFRERRVGTAATQFPKLAAMGPGTAEELARYGRQADLTPEQFRAESLAGALASDAAGKRFLLARASRGREVLAEQLFVAGAVVEQVVVYTSTDVEHPSAEAAALLRDGKIDWITVTSSAIARSLARLFGEQLRRAKLASISPITSGVLRELGYESAAEAAEYTLAGLTAAIVAHQRAVSSIPRR
ncbi:MAG: uroporphyrinogen-III synthase [Thermoguttaceae bacterium]|jgi:uroporphyrinogen III methyltransferase/synthase